VLAKPPVRFVKIRDGWVGYQVAGEGPPDFLLIPAFAGHLDWLWEAPGFSRLMSHLASRGRFIVLDRRGCGCSDPLPQPASYLDEWMFDVVGVLDEVGSERVALIGIDTASPMALILAATFPERVSALVLFEAYARVTSAPGYEIGHSSEITTLVQRFTEARWGEGWGLLPDGTGDPYLADLYARLERAAMSRSEAAHAISLWFDLDVRDVVPSIRAPALLFHASQNPVSKPEFGRYVAEHLREARLVEYPSRSYHGWTLPDHLPMILGEIDRFLSIDRVVPSSDRVLATVLFTDIVASTEQMAAVGDREWRQQIQALDDRTRQCVRVHDGRVVKGTGDGALATFEGPARAIAAAREIIQAAKVVGVEVRAGLHTGEIELQPHDVTGLAVHIAARVCDRAQPAQVLVTRTVKDLVVGSGLQFVEQGEHELKGIPETWSLYSVSSS
jgi:class 3 adenylate cyclase/pimeloyl-ACP methyl ester carboxylesterase